MNCFYCTSFNNKTPLEVAHHIFDDHPSKRRGWATKVLTNVEQLNYKVDHKPQDRVPLTEEEKEAKRSTQRQLSGHEKPVQTLCPVCNSHGYQVLPVEYVTSNFAWRNQGTLIVSCQGCRK